MIPTEKRRFDNEVNNTNDADSADGDSEGGNDGEQVKPKKQKVECIIGDKTEEELRNMNP